MNSSSAAQKIQSYKSAGREGGRHLKAITYNQNLNQNEVALLHMIGSRCNFTRDFLEWLRIYECEFVFETRMSIRTVRRTLQTVQAKGYLEVEAEFRHGKQVANKYRLLPKLFEEHLAKYPTIKNEDLCSAEGDNMGNFIPGQNCQEPAKVANRYSSSFLSHPEKIKNFKPKTAPSSARARVYDPPESAADDSNDWDQLDLRPFHDMNVYDTSGKRLKLSLGQYVNAKQAQGAIYAFHAATMRGKYRTRSIASAVGFFVNLVQAGAFKKAQAEYERTGTFLYRAADRTGSAIGEVGERLDPVEFERFNEEMEQLLSGIGLPKTTLSQGLSPDNRWDV